ncbi:unnamed protein product [Rotaria magnacalcarata]|uniref:Reticulon-like protein n=5 Tax=Rotaria magnacalcarata TaxID=392030 RepID=A0A819P484_9BILA|nr:unnamed protein product [Rotaria magnacalcarata]CAF2048737.1 unnamed protein product [Rotaria magnacalcarata]CAF2053520.1 unnamed protein product [Rotaria magnacalcarata]CAF2117669.1 unnamed protein product [Rotaria magnacalcarata]CAF4006999.1 unnamed protein product [Rotaria magnacalcarata]
MDPTTDSWNKSSSNDRNEASTTESISQNYTPVDDSYVQKGRTELKHGQQHAENIVSKTKRILQRHWDQTRHSLVEARKRTCQMIPKSACNLVYWRNPIQSGIVFGVSLSVIITFMCLSSLAAISFWLLAFLIVVGLNKLYNYVMTTFVGSARQDIFDSIFSSDIAISKQQADELAEQIQVNGTSLLKHARNIFLWQNLTNSAMFGLVLFIFFYIGLSMNTLTLGLVSLIFLFTVPKIYEVYQVPIDRTAKQILDQINQLLAKVTAKLPNKAKKA